MSLFVSPGRADTLHRESKNKTLNSCPQLPQMLIDFQNTFKDRLSGKFATKIIFKYPTTPNIQFRGGDYRGDGGTCPPPTFWLGGRKRKCPPPTNCPFSYFVDICLMFASQIQLKIIFCVLMVNLN